MSPRQLPICLSLDTFPDYAVHASAETQKEVYLCKANEKRHEYFDNKKFISLKLSKKL